MSVLALAALLLTLLAACSTSTARTPTPTATLGPTSTPAPTIYPTPPGLPFSLYLAGGDGTLYALNSGDLSVRWRSAVGVSSMLLADGVLYTVSSSGIVAFRAADGFVLWSAAGPGDTSSQPSGPALAMDSGLLCYGDGATLHALDARTGRARWKRTLTAGVAIPSAIPVAAGGVVYVENTYAPDSNRVLTDLYALRAADGAVLWHENVATTSEPAVIGRYYYYLPYDGVLHTLSLADGHQIWQFRPPDGNPPYTPPGSLVVADGVAYLATSAHLYALNAGSGAMQWQDGLELPGYYAPVAAGGRLFIATAHTVFAVNAADGNELWENHDNYGWSSAPIVAGDTLYAFGQQEIALLRAQSGVVFAAYPFPVGIVTDVPILVGP
jgi:outer membrane protein assembly factor BamB